MGCGKWDGKPWREQVCGQLQNAWPDDSFTIYKQDVEYSDDILAWLDHHAGKATYNLIHLGFPGSVNLLALAARIVSQPNVWLSMDSQHPPSTFTLLNSWAHNEVLSSPMAQVLRMIAKRDSELN